MSNVGDWEFALAVSTALAARLEGPELAKAIGLLVAAQVGPAAVFGLLFAGPIVDRFPRGPLMVTADVVRLVATASLLLAPHPSMLHLWCVAACLGVFGALFQPSLLASVPNVVAEEQITAANAIMTGTFHAAIMVGPALGAALVAFLGPAPAYALNAASFGVSAVLVATARIPRHAGEEGSWAPVSDLVAGARYIARTALARGIVIAMFLLLFFTAMKRPAETMLVRDVLTDGSTRHVAWVLGLLAATWGSGMVAGSLAAPALSARWPRERLLVAGIAVVGLSILVASRVPSVAPMMVLWVIGGSGMGSTNVVYESLLQERTPDRMRGRVFATIEAVQEGAYFLGAVWIGLSGSSNAVRSYTVIGSAFLIIAAITSKLLGNVDRELDVEPGAAALLGKALHGEPS